MSVDGSALKERAVALLAHVASLRQAGGGEVPLAELMEVLGVEPEGELRSQLEARGPMEVRFGEDGHGSFSNRGPAFSTPLGPAKLIVPGEIAGTLILSEGALELDFDPQKTMCGKILIMEKKVQRLEVSEHHVAVRFPGGLFDQEWRF
jgi:hypothetical protein